MKKRLFALLFCLALSLSACGQGGGETPPPTAAETAPAAPEGVTELWGFPIDDTHDAFAVATGGKLGTVLVTVESREKESEKPGDEWNWLFDREALISVWNPENMEKPIQTMVKPMEGSVFGVHDVVDANFDGYLDFGCQYFAGNQPTYWYYWIWDEAKGTFAEEPAFSVDETGEAVGGICMPAFDPETKTVSGYARYGMAGAVGVSTFHRWEEGRLVCVRRVATDMAEGSSDTVVLTVEDRLDGRLTEVFREKYPLSGGGAYQESEKWYDLDYHGEDGNTLWGFPIDDTHDAFAVATGGKLGTVLVTVELGKEGEHGFSVWAKDDFNTPFQTMTAEGTQLATWHDVVDANFDGYIDFGYVKLATPHTLYYNYWLWDEEQKQFIIEPQLAEIPEPQFGENTKTVFGRYSTWNYGHDSIYQWQGTDLACVREITISRRMDEKGTWLDQYEWTVKTLVENELVEIHCETVDVPADVFFTMDSIDSKWYDLSYYGK